MSSDNENVRFVNALREVLGLAPIPSTYGSCSRPRVNAARLSGSELSPSLGTDFFVELDRGRSSERPNAARPRVRPRRAEVQR